MEASMGKRSLKDLVSVGPAVLKDFERLGIRSVEELARQEPSEMYQRLCQIIGKTPDLSVEDVFSAAVAQARNPKLPDEQKNWWYWACLRKGKNR
jgi:predicted RecB family nuclease